MARGSKTRRLGEHGQPERLRDDAHTADRTIVLRSAAATAAGTPTLIIASGPPPAELAASPPSLRVSPQDAEELSDILSVGSRVVVRK